MLGLGRIQNGARRWIGKHRQSGLVTTVHRLAKFFDSAYENEGSSFEHNGERAMLKRLRAANFQIAMDVGANFGDWSLSCMELWPRVQVHAFEVAPVTFETLKGQTQNFGADRLILNCAGLGEQDGTLPMYYYPNHPELTCESPRHSAAQEIFDASIITGNRYAAERGIREIDFLKIDVEGSEYRVLRGFSELLANQKIHCIQFEYGAFSIQTRFMLSDYYSMLGEHYWIGKIYPTYVGFADYDWLREDFKFANFCCVSRQRRDLRDLLGG